MSHYNLYEDLGLQRSESSTALAEQLDARLKSLNPEEHAERDKLSTARRILGSAQRRAVYDQELDDATAPSITIARLREIAALDSQPTSAQQGWSNQDSRVVQVRLPKPVFAVADVRSRTGTVQWLIATTFVALGWIFVLFAYFRGELSVIDVQTLFSMAVSHTIGVFVISEVIWQIRVLAGGRKARSGSQ